MDEKTLASLTHVSMVQSAVAIAAVSLLIDKSVITQEEVKARIRQLSEKTFGSADNQFTTDALALIDSAVSRG